MITPIREKMREAFFYSNTCNNSLKLPILVQLMYFALKRRKLIADVQ